MSLRNDSELQSSNTFKNNYRHSRNKESDSRMPSILERLHAGYFRISLSMGAQALLWKILTQHPYFHVNTYYYVENSNTALILKVFHLVPSVFSLLLWILSTVSLFSLSTLYIFRCFLHFDSVKAEFIDHVGVNYFFAPWISWLLLLQSAPVSDHSIRTLSNLYLVLWWVFSAPIMALDVKIYGQWFTAEKSPVLANVANPTSQITVLGNLVAAQAAAEAGRKEVSVCMFSLGMAHYLVLFVTLYQHLSEEDRFPAMLRPVFFLFFAVPSVSSVAWSTITGFYDTASKMLFFLSLFLLTSLACRPNLFKRSMKKFNVAWWAYSFPLTFLALASVEYAEEVKGHFSLGLMLLLSSLSVLVFIGLIIFTILHVFKHT